MTKRTMSVVLAAVLMSLPVTVHARKPEVRQVTLEPTQMRYGDPVRTGIPFAKDPTVIRKGGTYYMYYTIAPYTPGSTPSGLAPLESDYNSAIATSKDLIHWTRVGDLDLRDTEGKRIWGAIAPCVKRFGGKIHLFYQRCKDLSGGNRCIWHAVSRDGITFVNTCDEPIFVPDTDWSIDRAIDAEVYRVGDKLILMYATRDKSATVQMLGMAQAPYHSDYGPDKWTLLSTDGPFLAPEHPWEGHCIEAPTVIRHKGVWYLFYAGAYNHERQQLGLATSTDGYHFERIAPDGMLYPAGEAGTWNHGESGHPGVFRDRDGQVYLFFQGKASRSANYLLSVLKVNFE